MGVGVTDLCMPPRALRLGPLAHERCPGRAGRVGVSGAWLWMQLTLTSCHGQELASTWPLPHAGKVGYGVGYFMGGTAQGVRPAHMWALPCLPASHAPSLQPEAMTLVCGFGCMQGEERYQAGHERGPGRQLPGTSAAPNHCWWRANMPAVHWPPLPACRLYAPVDHSSSTPHHTPSRCGPRLGAETDGTCCATDNTENRGAAGMRANGVSWRLRSLAGMMAGLGSPGVLMEQEEL